ncbi:hypothetical protein BXY85_3932 [Roseivirga pacifica]|uniref:Uncharacterized protein n=1 Tax=Roseivirga pacifica TaxID=1267423 RepID=A0A1I0Q2C9_9BACT|nr:hypothetical protein [Roseivirga pacifica]RKQ43313.1 hypothetical protein BXY85_3932 [Roseivirga pacifica]SEW21017.1 hypothetical protein SAMN05216290_1943 [Roseivirga pacifica]
MRIENRTLLLLFALLLAFACDPKEDTDPAVEAAENMKFTQLMPTTAYATASSIMVSPNERYMIFFGAHKPFYSKDGGQTVEELFVYGNATGHPINISNDGLFVYGGGVYDLDNIRSGSAAIHHATGVTDSGKLVYIQNDGANGKTFFIDDNGTYVSTGVRLEMGEEFYLGTFGEKMGFFDWRNKIIAEFDVSTQTYTQTTLTNMDYKRLYGLGNDRNKVKTAYSYGYFAYAKEGGVIIITPEGEIRYYEYPEDYRIYRNTEGGMKLYKDKAYVNIYDRWGVNQMHLVSGNSIEPVDNVSAIAFGEESVFTQGFLEGGDRFRGGIIKTVNGQQEYLPLDMGYQYPGGYMFGKTYVIGDYAYAEDKVFSRNSETYATSSMGNITSILHDDGRTIAYAEKGTFTTSNGKDWNLESTDPLTPELVAKGADGIYHALTVEIKVYVSPSTQARSYSADLKAYTSNNGIDWTEVSGSATSHPGYGPRLISSDGTVYTQDTNAGSIGSAKLSDDFGVTWQGLLNGMNLTKNEPLPEGFKTSHFELGTGKFVSIVFEFGGEMGVSVCDSSTGGCTEQVLEVSFDAADMYTHDEEITHTANDEFVFNTLEGIYISNPLK